MTQTLKALDIFASESSKALNPTQTKGTPGNPVIGGYIMEDERSANLKGTRKYKTYSDLLANVSIVAAGVRYFLNLVSKAEWKVTPADESSEAERFAEIITRQMKGMQTSWPRVVRRAAMYRFYGFSVQEWTAERKEGDLLFKDIAPRPQVTIERWDVNRAGEVLGIIQTNSIDFQEDYLPRKKTIYIVDDSLNDSPEGLGLFRHIVKSCDRLTRYEQLEGYGFESDLRGIPVGRAPFAALQDGVDTGQLTKTEMSAAIAPITSFVTNHIKNPALGILLDSITYQDEGDNGAYSNVPQWSIDLLKGSATSFADVAVAIERVNREIARTLGVEGLLLGESTSGSHALSKDKSLNFALIVDSTLTELVDTFQKDMIARLFEINGWPEDKMPTFNTEAIQHRDITQITQALKDLANAGALIASDDPAVTEIYEMLGLSAPPERPEEDFGENMLGGNPEDKTDDEGET
jgi:hypothetical protein